MKKKTSTRQEVSSVGVLALIRKFEENIGDSECRISVGDYIRLLQLARELNLQEPRQIEVRWVDPPENQLESPSGE